MSLPIPPRPACYTARMATPEVLILGSGDAFFAAGRHQPAYLVRAAAGSFLLDCGATALASMKHHGVDPASIDAVLLSHLHGDHFSGLPFLFLEYIYVAHRTRSLTIAGPPGTEERVRRLFRTMYRETAEQPLRFPLRYVEMLPDTPLAIDSVRVEPFRVPHQEHEISLALKLQVDGRKILYSGDTGWTEELVRHAAGTDLFLCECCFYETRVSFHLDYPRILENRERFGTKRLVLTHLGREVLDRPKDLEIELATDGLTIPV